MTNKIKDELIKRLDNDELACGIKMKKSKDIIVIEAQDAELDEETEFIVTSLKIRSIYVTGITNLAHTIRTYDEIVEKRENKIKELYIFARDRIQTRKATKEEKTKYAHDYEQLFGYNPFTHTAI